MEQEANPDRLLEATRAAELAAKAQQRLVNKALAVAGLFDFRVALNEITGWAELILSTTETTNPESVFDTVHYRAFLGDGGFGLL